MYTLFKVHCRFRWDDALKTETYASFVTFGANDSEAIDKVASRVVTWAYPESLFDMASTALTDTYLEVNQRKTIISL